MRICLGLVLVAALAGCRFSQESSPAGNPSNEEEATSTPTACGGGSKCCEVGRHQVIALQNGATKGSWPLWGGSPGRNMVNLVDKDLPTDWDVNAKTNIRWSADLGKKTYGGPVVAGGKIFVGTNNEQPRDPKIKGEKSVVMCFQESDGKFLWQAVHDAPVGERFNDVLRLGLLSTPVVDGSRLYYVLPQSEVICADVETGKTLWTYDMTKELKVVPYHCSNCSPLVAGDKLFVVTGNGVDADGKVINPDAPSFIALDKTSGKLAWKSSLPGDRVIEGQWSNPVYGEIAGKPQVIFPGGDAVLYSFEPDTGKLIWKFNCHAKRKKVPGDRAIDNYIVSTPVIHDNKVYVGLGLYPEHHSATRFSYLMCVDATKSGDVSPGTSLDPKAADNKDSALVWAFGGPIEPRPKQGRSILFGRTISTCAVHDGLVYISEEDGYLHCLDAKTGSRYWINDFKTGVWSSPYYVDGKIYIGTDDSEVVIFQPGKTLKVLNKIDMGDPVQSTVVAANNTLYITTKSKLYAIAEKK